MAGPRVLVAGAGAFGGWTALWLQRRGARVVLVDPWGPGHSRASSGGETRIIRAVYGADRIYVEMAARALELWRAHEQACGVPLLRRTGVIWIVTGDDAFERAAMPLLADAGLPCEALEPGDVARRWPPVRVDDVRWALFEREAGYLLARRACATVVDMFLREGGEYRRAAARAAALDGPVETVELSDGGRVAVDHVVLACGPWLGPMVPDVPGARLRVTRQDVFFFGAPPGDARFTDERLPVWIERGPRMFYGVPCAEGRGVKVADDTRGPEVDPTRLERIVAEDRLRDARAHLAWRFPALSGAPLVESRVCQYENSADGHFILDRHPRAANVWIAGGGSGHGFKFGPVVGERMAAMVLGERPVDPCFALARFETRPIGA
jgi:glycine/D-amino acid oxidase-like deaminating enzyme